MKEEVLLMKFAHWLKLCSEDPLIVHVRGREGGLSYSRDVSITDAVTDFLASEGKVLLKMAQDLRTQDNRATEHPIFMVQQLRKIYGVGQYYCDGFAWVYEEGGELAEGEHFDLLEAEHITTGKDYIDGHYRLYYRNVWESIQPFFTEAGANRYIEENKHNLLPEARVYVESAYRNSEWQAIRELLLSMKEVPNE